MDRSLHPDNETTDLNPTIALAEEGVLGAFDSLTVDEKLNVLYAIVTSVQTSQVQAQAVITETLGNMGPMLEKMQKNPMFKLLF